MCLYSGPKQIPASEIHLWKPPIRLAREICRDIARLVDYFFSMKPPFSKGMFLLCLPIAIISLAPFVHKDKIVDYDTFEKNRPRISLRGLLLPSFLFEQTSIWHLWVFLWCQLGFHPERRSASYRFSRYLGWGYCNSSGVLHHWTWKLLPWFSGSYIYYWSDFRWLSSFSAQDLPWFFGRRQRTYQNHAQINFADVCGFRVDQCNTPPTLVLLQRKNRRVSTKHTSDGYREFTRDGFGTDYPKIIHF